MSRADMCAAAEEALGVLAPMIVRHGGPIALAAMATAMGLMLVERHRATMRGAPALLQDELRMLQGALDDAVVGAVEGLPPGRVP